MYLGECFGTFLLVFIGTGTVGVAVLFGALTGLLQVALVWGGGVTLAIYATRHLSWAHLNPAVSLAMVVAGRMRPNLLFGYVLAQISGAIIAGIVVYALFHTVIGEYEAHHGIVRGSLESVKTAMMFGEYFPNPGNGIEYQVSLATAMAVEALGTFLLVTMIFSLTEGCNIGRPSDTAVPVFIGMTVTILIAILAPFTQTGINPARDLGPRLVAYFCGWNDVAIPGPRGGFFWVYIFSPLAGGTVSAITFRYLVEPLMNKKNS